MMPVAKAGRRADRKSDRQTRHGGEVTVELRAGRLVIVRRNGTAIDREKTGEQRRPRRAKEKARDADVAEAHRREVQFDHRLGVAASADLADLEAREPLLLAVSLDLAVIDVIIAERAEEEVAQRAFLPSRRSRRGGVNPKRRIAPRQRHSI